MRSDVEHIDAVDDEANAAPRINDFAQRSRLAIRLTGVVQGVGFRPHVHRIAMSLDLDGLVGNDDEGVFVEVQGPPDLLARFLDRVQDELPPMARIDTLDSHEIPLATTQGFTIVASRHRVASAVTLIPPDTASCHDCLREVDDADDRRYRYPFTACTYCGPRYTIITGLPYDRPDTTMSAFPLCAACAREYENPSDRRFHAQPTACPDCGPHLWYRTTEEEELQTQAPTRDAALCAAIRAIAAGRIVAVKGIGGYHLVCNARDVDAVQRLRRRKGRGRKPFAVMVRDLDVATELVRLSPTARDLLASPEAPIVLAPALDGSSARAVAESVAPGNGNIGILLPYSPLHQLLFAPHPEAPDIALDALVMTSGNLADEPICIDPQEADERLSGVADAWLHHNRPIHVACDDSVVRTVDDLTLPVRRSRGYAPLPIGLPIPAPSTLAVGGELKTTLCLAEGRRAWMSQHIGDTENLQTLDQLALTAELLGRLSRITPDVVVADKHPAYLTRRWAQDHARAIGARFVTVQHHHAHLASLLAEHGCAPGDQVMGFVFDGTGFGDDGTIWGGEILLGDYAQAQRVGHVRTVLLPGGDAAIRRPARVALAHLEAAGITWEDDLPPVAVADTTERRVLATMLSRGVGCSPTTSMGRVFDAVASLLGVCHDVEYEGQAAIELEGLAAGASVDPDEINAWKWQISGDASMADPVILDPAGSLVAGVSAVRAGASASTAARAFHEAVADAVLDAAVLVRRQHAIKVVGLTGGVFQNALLTSACAGRLEQHGFTVLTHRTVPPNDGGLALGQAAIVAGRGEG